ncbi:MAG: hypothetical protein EPO28_10900 [Saprospiraceae bacterium]|nr:MAG: hypothetical protein EPO28_10900 [Saprospiraceae bacterium]
MSKTLYTFLLALLPIFSAAQISNLRSKSLPVLCAPQLLDSLTVVPNSVIATNPATGERISPVHFKIENNHITFDSTILHSPFSILNFSYRVLPFNLSTPLARLDTNTLVRNSGDRLIGFKYDPYAGEAQPLLPQKGLDYNGNFTRGISFGNNQNLVLNSQFSLQMAGSLGDMEVLAAITDNNIPLQPEGNTQQLREFDKIFIQLSKDRNKLIAGDYELARPNSYFMNYFKKLQGATFSRQSSAGSPQPAEGKGYELKTQGSIAIARGKFARNTIPAQEGNQGPFRLQGAEGERFIIVLAGTEKVFVDGQLMQRGLDADYVIDYNAGHLTFTNRRLITKDSRIAVEFDYADQNYLRSLYAVNTELKSDKLRLYLNTYSEQDGRQPVDENFSESELGTLRLSGDSSQNAVVSSIDTVAEFSAFRVLYEMKDTLVEGVLYSSVLVFSFNQERAKYTAGFSNVGTGNGNYLPDTETAANGRVYRWVAPDPITGQPRGEYEPVHRLVAPKQQQLYTAGIEAAPSNMTKLRAEVALSNFDQNRLSGLNDGDNVGLAATAGVRQVFEFGGTAPSKESDQALPLLPGQGGGWRIETEANYEVTQRKFKELNPYRPQEFTRDWNTSQGINDVSINNRLSNEHLASAGFTLHSPKAGSLQYRFGGFFRDTLYTGLKHFTKYTYLKNGYDVWLQGDFLNTTSPLEESRFQRPKFNFSLPFLRDTTGTKFWKAGIYGEREKNSRYARDAQNAKSDTLGKLSFYYDLVKVFVEMPESERFSFKTNFQRRRDHAPVGPDFESSTVSGEVNVQGNWRQSRNSRLDWNFTWRQLAVKDTALTNLDPSNTYVGRLDYGVNVLRGLVQSATSYEIGSGQERKVEFTYLEVPAGEGTHQWVDRNGDAVVQVDEVEIAPFQDVANAVRVTVFTDDFIRTNNVMFNQSLRLEPKAVWFNASGAKKFLSKFSTQSSLQITRKVRDAGGVSPWNPFQLNIVDTALVATRSSIYNTLFFNRSDPKYDVQLGMSGNQNKQVLTTGFESRRQQEQFFKLRWNITRALSFQPAFTFGHSEQGSQQFESKRYRIESFETEPKLSFQPSNSFRTSFSWRYETSENKLGTAGENARTHDLKLESVYNQSATTSIRSEFSLVNIRFEGQANSSVGFAFLNGLQNGKNYIWSLALDRQIGKNIRLGISYEGRKTGTANMVHVGRAQVGAVF